MTIRVVDDALPPASSERRHFVSIADVTIRFERAYAKHLKGALRAKVEEFLQRTGLGLSLGAYGIRLRGVEAAGEAQAGRDAPGEPVADALAAGLARATEAVDSGAAAATLDRWVAATSA